MEMAVSVLEGAKLFGSVEFLSAFNSVLSV